MTSLRLLLLIPIAAACSDLTKIDTLSGRIETDPAIDFGDVQIGLIATREITVRNTGALSLSITGIIGGDAFSTSSYTFAAAPTSFSLAPGLTQVVSVSFQAFEEMAEPARTGFDIETDAIDASGAVVSAHVDVSGRGVRSALRVEPNPIDFGTVLVGSSRTIDVVITNDLTADVLLSTPVDAGRPAVTIDAGSGQFTILASPSADGSLGMLAAGASLTVQARYVPDPGPTGVEDLAHWQVSNCPNPFCAVVVEMRARGSESAIACTPASVDFGAVNPGRQVSRTIDCTNAASDPIEVIDWELDPNSSSAFRADPFPGVTTVASGESFSVTLAISPTLADLMNGGTLTGELVIRGRNTVTTDGLMPVRIALSGTTGGPAIRVLPEALDFGELQIGTRDRRFLLVTNDGFDSLQVSMIAAGSAEFSAGAASLDLDAGTSTTVEVWFASNVLGAVTSELVISSNDASAPEITVPLSGLGIDLGPCVHTVMPAQINFGIATIPEAPLRQFAIENVGAGTCVINRLELSGAPFALTGGLPRDGIMIGPGQTQLVDVQYQPLASGTHAGQVSFYISDPAQSDEAVTLFGVALGNTSIECPAPITVDAGTPVTLALNATSQTGTVASYSWGVTSAPAGAIGTPGQWQPDPPDQPTEVFLPRLVGEYAISATITDGLGFTETCTTSVTARGHGLRVELTWDGLGDVDLHLHNSTPTAWFGAPMGSNADDCFYANCSESSNPSGPVWDAAYFPYEGKNPALDIDNIIGFGPENIRVDTVEAGESFTVALHYFWDHGYGQRAGFVNLYCGPTVIPTASFASIQMDGPDQGGCTENTFWRVATVTFTSSTGCSVTPIDTYSNGIDACANF